MMMMMMMMMMMLLMMNHDDDDDALLLWFRCWLSSSPLGSVWWHWLSLKWDVNRFDSSTGYRSLTSNSRTNLQKIGKKIGKKSAKNQTHQPPHRNRVGQWQWHGVLVPHHLSWPTKPWPVVIPKFEGKFAWMNHFKIQDSKIDGGFKKESGQIL